MGVETDHDPRAAWLARLRDPDAPDPGGIARDLDWLAGPGRCLVTEDDPRYPRQLAVEPRMPAALFVEGDPEHLSRPQVAIVGSRAATASGCETAFDFAARLAAEGFAITSGLATGIGAPRSRSAAPGSTACTRPRTPASRRRSRRPGRSSASFPPARRPSRTTSRAATG
jgi:hypothetical protein